MTKNVLKSVQASMQEMGLEYGFRRYRKKPVVYPYFVGDYMETDPFSEDGLRECTFTLDGFARGEEAETVLENAKDTIRSYFTTIGKDFLFDGSVVVIMYGYTLPVPVEDAELDRIQINLTVKEWSVE